MTTPSIPLYREIPLTKGQIALVDEEDYERIAAQKWCAFWHKGIRAYYAVRAERDPVGSEPQSTCTVA